MLKGLYDMSYHLKLDNNQLSIEEKIDTLKYFNSINLLFSIFRVEKSKINNDTEIESLIEKRIEAKKNKDFKTSDEIRDTLLNMGIILEDTKSGVKWKRK
jgi:cysteinyl-tRNA synthetase